METTILWNIATLKAFSLADMKGRSFFIINVVLVDICRLFSMFEHDWKYHFHLLLGVSCMAWLSNSNTHCKVQYDSTPRLSKDIYNKYSGFMQSLKRNCWTYRGQLHALTLIFAQLHLQCEHIYSWEIFVYVYVGKSVYCLKQTVIFNF